MQVDNLKITSSKGIVHPPSVVLLVLNNFTNDSRVLKEARSLLKAGCQVSVCAMHDAGLPESEDLDGIRVHRIRLVTRSWPKKKVVQLVKYVEFVARAFFKFRSMDIFHCNDLNALPVGVIAKKLSSGKKVLYDAHEYEIDPAPGLSAKQINRLFRLERYCIKHADAVTVTSEVDAVEYARLYAISKPKVVMNCPPYRESEVSADHFRKTFGIADSRTIFLFQGALDPSRGISTILEAFSHFHGTDRCIVFMGYGPMMDSVREYAERVDSIFYHDAVSPDVLHGYTRSADCGIIFMSNLCAGYNYALPNKLFEYAMAGIPTLSTPLLEISRMINDHSMGVLVEGDSAEHLRETVATLTRENLLAFAPALEISARLFCWEEQEKVLLEAYAEVCQ